MVAAAGADGKSNERPTTIPGDVTPLSVAESGGITTAISLLRSALQMHDLDDVRRNIVLARSTLFDVLTSIGPTSAT
jgi:hypothetical protein